MLNRRLYTFIVASHADSRLWRISLPYSLVLAVLVFALIGLLSAGVAGYHYAGMLLRVSDYNHVLAENDSFRSENHNYRIQTAQLGEKLDFLETTARKLALISGMDKGFGGIGGFSRDTLSQPLPASAGTLVSIDRYNKEVTTLEERLRGIEDTLSYQAILAASKPAFLPVKGYVTARMGWREDPFNSKARDHHTGIDISAPYGTRVLAPADGTVLFAGYRAGYGNIIVIDHKFGVTTRYGHLSKSTVQIGQRVSRSEIIGYVGSSGRSTGPHLHFEYWVHGRAVNPLKYISVAGRG